MHAAIHRQCSDMLRSCSRARLQSLGGLSSRGGRGGRGRLLVAEQPGDHCAVALHGRVRCLRCLSARCLVQEPRVQHTEMCRRCDAALSPGLPPQRSTMQIRDCQYTNNAATLITSMPSSHMTRRQPTVASARTLYSTLPWRFAAAASCACSACRTANPLAPKTLPDAGALRPPSPRRSAPRRPRAAPAASRPLRCARRPPR